MIVVKATTACFSDMVRVAGYLVPRRMAVVNVESDGYKVTEVSAAEGDQVDLRTGAGAVDAAGVRSGGQAQARAGAQGGQRSGPR